MDKLRIGFWGTPKIASEILQHILTDTEIEVAFTVTQKDKPRSKRNRKILPSPVKKTAQENRIPVLEPESLKKEKDIWISEFKKYKTDFYVILAYGKIIPKEIYTIPSKDSINFHGSLLPKLRGASPIETALLEGFSETGWTMQKIGEEMDAGDILTSSRVGIDLDETKDSLYEKMTKDLVENILEWIKEYGKGNLKQIPQKEEEATYCGKINSSMGKINWEDSHQKIKDTYAAFSEKPGIYTFWNNRKVKIKIDLPTFIAHANQKNKIESYRPGEVLQIDQFVWIQTGDFIPIPIYSFQPEGKKEMGIKDFINGWGLKVNSVFNNV